MTPLERAQKIIDLHKGITYRTARLKEIETVRSRGTRLAMTFCGENRSGYVSDLLKVDQRFMQGELTDLAALVLARLADEHAHALRMLKTQLVEAEQGW